jgi:hypothetical protein
METIMAEHINPSSLSLRPFDRPTDDGVALYLNAAASVKTLLAASLARAENLQAWLELLECSNSEIAYQPRELASMLSPGMNDLLTLLRAASDQALGVESHRSEPQRAKLFSIEGKEPKAG